MQIWGNNVKLSCLIFFFPPKLSKPYSSRRVIHQSDTYKTSKNNIFPSCTQIYKKKKSLVSHNLPLAALEPHLPFLPTPSLPASHSFSLPLACQTRETAWWLQSVGSSFTCRYCLGLWCRINWRHKKEWHSEILTELKSSRRW